MRHMIMNYSLLPTLILAFYFVCSNHVLAQYFIKFRVHIISAVPDDPTPLLIHCQSKDDDLDYHFLSNGQDFDWKFREKFLELLSSSAHSSGIQSSPALMFSTELLQVIAKHPSSLGRKK
ncbi:hypothetical protein ACSBR2_028787 [Camellia fascicularis]